MSLTGNVARVGLLQNEMLPAALNQRVACLRIKNEQLYINYLFHFLNSDKFENDAIFSASGIAQKNMSTEWLKKYTIPVPPREEQERIVAELDCLSGVIEKKKQQLRELDALAQSIFYTMFGNPITNEKGWEVKKFEDCYKLAEEFFNNETEGIFYIWGHSYEFDIDNTWDKLEEFLQYVSGREGIVYATNKELLL
jgi:type I restriction enzyme S subunit